MSLLLTALALSMDAVAVSLSCGMSARRLTAGQVLKVGLFFGGFQALMPALGYLAGSGLHGLIASLDHWIAFVLLAFIGGRMIWEQRKGNQEDCEPLDPTDNRRLLLMAIATSIDALAVGVGLAMTQVDLLPAALCIGMVTFVLSVVALLLGKRIGYAFSRYAGILGGCILIGIGIKILIEHLTGAA